MDLTETECAAIVTLLEDGRSQVYVARTLSVSRSTVQNVYRRWLETGAHRRRAGSGRRRITSQRDDRFIVLASLRNRHLTAVNIQNRLLNVRRVQVSEWTVRRRLHEVNLRSYRPASGPKLNQGHRVTQLTFAREHFDWSLDE